MGTLTGTDSARLERVASLFAGAFVEETGQPMLAARRQLLGPTTVWRARRVIEGKSLGQRIADVGLSVRGGARRVLAREPVTQRIDASASGPVVASGLVAWRLARSTGSADAAPATLAVGPKCPLAEVRAALAPLIEPGELVLEEVAAYPRRTRAVVAPYFYAPGDLRRVAEALALEQAVPSPHSDGGLEICIARGWDQRLLFRERLDAACEAVGASAPPSTEIDVDSTPDLLEKVRHLPAADAVAAFVYPMLRERPQVEAALQALVAECDLGIVNHTPAIAWALGHAVRSTSVLVEADQRMRGAASARAMSRRATFEAHPSVGRAVAALAWSWVG